MGRRIGCDASMLAVCLYVVFQNEENGDSVSILNGVIVSCSGYYDSIPLAGWQSSIDICNQNDC